MRKMSKSTHGGGNPAKRKIPSESKSEFVEEVVLSDEPSNKFANDGSFLEMFKKMQESQSNQTKPPDSNSSSTNEPCEPKTATTQSVKRRKVLRTGVIRRPKEPTGSEEVSGSSGAWSKYMNEVRKYREMHGDDSDKNRPLVK